MRLRRSESRFRQRRRSSGCLTLFAVIIAFAGLIFMGRERLRAWLTDVLQPRPVDLSIASVEAAFMTGDLNTAIDHSQQRYARDAQDSSALTQLVRSLIYRSYVDYNFERDRAFALELTRAAYTRVADDPAVMAIHAYAQQANGLSEDAAILALRALRRDERSMPARLALSLSYGSRGIFDAALRDALRAVEITMETAPNWRADAYRVLAIAYSDLGRYQEAINAADSAISYNRRLIPLHFERALYAIQLGDMDSATAHYFNIIAFQEDNVKARLRLCEVSSKLGERDAALDYCTQVTQRAPGWADGWYYLGREHYLNGDWYNTRQALGRCSNLQVAQDIPIVERRFECWYLQGQAAEVLRDCPTLLRLYREFQQMAASASLPQTWTYPPGGPPVCSTPQAVPAG